MKPWKNDKLLATIYSGLQYRNSKHELFKLKNQNEQFSSDMRGQFGKIIGESLAMKKVFDIISKVAETDADVLVLGENGTGKEMVAREIHNQSKLCEYSNHL